MSAKTRWFIAAGVVLVFFAGIATGVFAGAWRAKQVFIVRHGPQMSERLRERIERELQLTPEQLQQARPIFDETARELDAIREETGRRVAETMAKSHRRMAAFLTPEQQERLKRMQQRHRLRIKMRGLDRHPPPPLPDEE